MIKLYSRVIYLVTFGIAVTGINSTYAATIVAGSESFFSSGEITISVDGFSPETISLNDGGIAATVHRDAQIGNTIDTEIVSLDLFGTSTQFGAIHLRVGTGNAIPVALASTGQVINVLQDLTEPAFGEGDPSSFLSGDSSFDIFFEIDIIGPGYTFGNESPNAATYDAGTIFFFPPASTREYEMTSPTDFKCISGPCTGIEGTMDDGLHTGFQPVPIPAAVWLFGSALGILGWMRRRRIH